MVYSACTSVQEGIKEISLSLSADQSKTRKRNVEKMTLLLPIEDCLWKYVSHTLSHKFGVVDLFALCSTVNLSNTHVDV